LKFFNSGLKTFANREKPFYLLIEYRSRFIGQMNMTMAALKGQGKLKRNDFAASVEGASPGQLRLEHIGGGIYRLEVRSSTTLGPLPVL